MKSAPLSMQEQKNIHIEKTVNEQRGRLLNFIKKMVSRSEDAEDILQDVFYQFVIGYNNIQSWEQASSWLFRVARNKITDNYRKKKPESFSNIRLGNSDDNEPLMLEDILPEVSGNTPENYLMGEMIWSEIENILAKIPPEQAQVFIWHEFEQKSFKEMSTISGDPVNTLISRKRYAILALREGLSEMYKDLIND